NGASAAPALTVRSAPGLPRPFALIFTRGISTSGHSNPAPLFPCSEVASMILSWLRLLSNKRFQGATRRPRRGPTRLEVEVLESRTMPTVVTWTGNDVSSGNTRWSDAGNWKDGVIPHNFDDVVFPFGVPANNKINEVNGEKESPPDTTDGTGEPFNSFNDLSLTLNTLTIGDRDFIIGGNPITLKQQLLGSSDFGSGVSLINFDIRLLGNPQSFDI